LSPEPTQRVEDETPVVLEQRVDERQLAGGLDQEGMNVAALPVPEAVDAVCELDHAGA
jgi:hypothetical protein